jgi:hypothetical protein
MWSFEGIVEQPKPYGQIVLSSRAGKTVCFFLASFRRRQKLYPQVDMQGWGELFLYWVIDMKK